VASACVNLKERFGGRFKVRSEESYRADRGDGARAEDPWMMILPCGYGHIFPHSGSLLAASVDGHSNVAGMLRRLPCCRVHQDGDFGELTVLFDVADLAEVAKIMRPRRRRQVSAAERARLVGMGFKKTGAQAHVDVEPTARGCDPASQAHLGAVADQRAPSSLQETP
jgi:hypothetical protein